MIAHRGTRALWTTGALWFALSPLSLFAAPPPLTVPPRLNVEPGRLCRIVATTDGKFVKWFSARSDCDLLPISDSGKIALFVAPSPGVYRVLCYTAAGDEPSDPAICEITVGSPPGPTPPVPPVPPDEISSRLQAVWLRETDSSKTVSAPLLADVYALSHKSLCYDPSINSAGLLLGAMQSAANSRLPKTALPIVRGEIKAYLNSRLKWTANTALTDTLRQQAADEFGRIERALRSLK